MEFVQIVCIVTEIYWHVAKIAGFLDPSIVNFHNATAKRVWLFEVSMIETLAHLNVSECTRCSIPGGAFPLSYHHYERRSNADLQVRQVIKMAMWKSVTEAHL